MAEPQFQCAGKITDKISIAPDKTGESEITQAGNFFFRHFAACVLMKHHPI